MKPRSRIPREQGSLLRAIVAQPDDDLVRLVYADWLDEHGDADRATFIRTQCELAGLPAGDARRVGLEVRAAVLLQRHREAWLGELAKWIDRSYVTFRRGFPWSVGTTRKAFLRNASSLAGRTVIQEAMLDQVASEEGQGIAGLPITTRLRSLRTYSSSFTDLHEVLSACTGLTALALFNTCDDGDVGTRLADLLALPSVRGVTQLTFRLRNWGDPARVAAEQVAAADLANLQTLGLDMRGLRHETLRALFRAPYALGLKTLSLIETFDAPALGVLDEAESLSGLRSLSLYLAAGGGAAFARLAGSPALGGLTDLCIGGRQAECEAALDSGLTGQLRALEIWSSESSRADRGQVVRPLADSGLTGLVRLRLHDHGVTDADIRVLASGHLPALTHIDLAATEVTADGLEALARSAGLPALRAVTVPGKLVGHTRNDEETLRTLTARFEGRFAVLGWASGSWGDLRLGVS